MTHAERLAAARAFRARQRTREAALAAWERRAGAIRSHPLYRLLPDWIREILEE